jgi:hypothetical protein
VLPNPGGQPQAIGALVALVAAREAVCRTMDDAWF